MNKNMEKRLYIALGNHVKTRRKKLKISQAELAKRVGVSQQAISTLERDHECLIFHNAVRILFALGLELKDFQLMATCDLA